MAKAEDHRPLWSKRKAITVLLPCAVWQERDGKPEMFDTILHVTRASRISMFMWDHVDQFVIRLLSEASPRTIVLGLPHVLHTLQDQLGDVGDLVRRWAAAACAVPHSEEIAQGVVDTLLQIASEGGLRYIPINLWSWLTKRPSLPPICLGRCFGTDGSVVKGIRALKDIEVLKSYLHLVWSEWDSLYTDGLDEMCTLIREDFGGVEMRHHRTDLIQRLDHVLAQLDRGLEYFQQHKLGFDEDHIQGGKNQYRKLRETLLEMDSRTPFTDYALPYTDSYPRCTQGHVRHLYAYSLPRVHSPTAEKFDAPTPHFACTSASILSMIPTVIWKNLVMAPAISRLSSIDCQSCG